MKKLLAMLLALVMAMGLVACAIPPETPEEPEAPAEKNILDIYLIAGQSNAAGHTKVENKYSLYKTAPELKEGYSHVLYAGNARRDDGTKAIDNEKTWAPTTLGLGIDRGGDQAYMGPDRKSTRLNSSHAELSRMPSSA